MLPDIQQGFLKLAALLEDIYQKVSASDADSFLGSNRRMLISSQKSGAAYIEIIFK